ncbi:MAG: CBS domain-containing protein [Geminicoccaceae bacterium]
MTRFADIPVVRAIRNPKGMYRSPAEVQTDGSLNDTEKLAILNSWEADALELEVAQEENMGGGETSELDEVIEARQRLKSSSGSERAKLVGKRQPAEADLHQFRARHFAQPQNLTIHVDQALEEAKHRLATQDSPYILVTDGAEIVGTLDCAQIASWKAAGPSTESLPLTVRHYMNSQLSFCYGDEPLATALAVVGRQTETCLLVIEPNGDLIGLLTRDCLPEGLDFGSRPLEDFSPERHEAQSPAMAKTVQPGGLDVYPDRPSIRLRR